MDGSKTCPSCGRINPGDAQWCVSCGKNLNQPMPPTSSPGQNYQSTANVNANNQITEAVRVRAETDEIMGGIWILLYILAPIISIIGVIVMFVGALGPLIDTFDPDNPPTTIDFGSWWVAAVVAVLISSVIYAVINYKLLKRKDDHIKREMALRAGIIDFFRFKSRERFMEQAMASQIATMQSIQSESMAEDREHSPVLYTVLVFIPIVGSFVQLYLAYILTKFDFKHDRRWHAFTQQAQSAGQLLGMPMVLPSWKTLPERSFFIYLILTFLTGGLFWFYWYYCFLKDLNDHFKAQWQFEDQFVRSMQ